MAKMTLSDRRAHTRVKQLARIEIKKAQNERLEAAVKDLDKDAILLSVKMRLADHENGQPYRAQVAVAIKGRRRVLIGEADHSFDAVMDALTNGYQPELPGTE